MSEITIKAEISLEGVHCAECGVLFAMPPNLVRSFRENHKTFKCPSGHSNFFPEKSHAELLDLKLADARSKLLSAQRELAEEKAKTKRAGKKTQTSGNPRFGGGRGKLAKVEATP